MCVVLWHLGGCGIGEKTWWNNMPPMQMLPPMVHQVHSFSDWKVNSFSCLFPKMQGAEISLRGWNQLEGLKSCAFLLRGWNNARGEDSGIYTSLYAYIIIRLQVPNVPTNNPQWAVAPLHASRAFLDATSLKPMSSSRCRQRIGSDPGGEPWWAMFPGMLASKLVSTQPWSN